MMATAHSMPCRLLEDALKRSFVEGTSWPIDPASLAALIDLGMSDGQIAAYFSIEPRQVSALRCYYGLAA